MTVDEWGALKKGDVILDRHFRGAERTILKVNRVKSKNSSLTRTALTVTNLKTKGRKDHTIIFETENTGPHRFDLKPRTSSTMSKTTQLPFGLHFTVYAGPRSSFDDPAPIVAELTAPNPRMPTDFVIMRVSDIGVTGSELKTQIVEKLRELADALERADG